jgi:hypothetical protein
LVGGRAWGEGESDKRERMAQEVKEMELKSCYIMLEN